MFTELFAKIQTKSNLKEYRKAHQSSMLFGLLSELAFGSGNAPQKVEHIKHPTHVPRRQEFIEQIEKLSKTKSLTINFGDSLTDLARKWLKDNFDGIYSIAGSWHYHMSDMAEDLQPYLSKYNIKNVAIGCLGGNPMLVYQDLQRTIDESIAALNKIRVLFPKQKFIVYGVPPTYNIFAGQNTFTFDAALYDWVKKDGNAVFVSLKTLGGFFPNVKWQNDGVHFTPNGALRFGKAIDKAKIASVGSIVSV